MRYILFIWFLGFGPAAHAQLYYQLYIDPNHYAALTENQAMRTLQERLYQDDTKSIRDDLDKVNVNLATLVAAKTVVFQALAQVNEALKDGLEVKYLAGLVAEIAGECSYLISVAHDSPQFLPFAEEASRQVRQQAIRLGTEVSDFILKTDTHNLMDFNSRDELLKSITYRLQLIRADIYGMSQAVTWARAKGMWQSLNPFAAYISEDQSLMRDIIRNAKQL